MRVSSVESDPAYGRTEWILASNAKIIVTLDGAVIEDVVTADEETGVVMHRFGAAVLAKKGSVFIRISLRD